MSAQSSQPPFIISFINPIKTANLIEAVINVKRVLQGTSTTQCMKEMGKAGHKASVCMEIAYKHMWQ